MADEPLTRRELGSAVGRRRRFRAAAAGLNSSSDTLLKPLMWQGDLCFGPARDGEATLQSLHRVARWAGLPSVEEAGPLAVQAYVRTYGPTTPAGVQYYLGAGLSASRKALRGWLDDLSDRLVTIDVDGEDLLVCADDVDVVTSTTATPRFACYRPPTRGSWDRAPQTPTWCRRHIGQAVTRGANLVLASGVVAGTWTRKAGILTVTWLGQCNPPDHDLLEDEAAHLAAILGAEVELSIRAA